MSAERPVVRAGLALVAGATGAVMLYAVLRALQAVVLPEPDPALVFFSLHAGYYWRAWTAAYAGGMLAFVGWVAARRDAARTARALAGLVLVAAALLAIQSLAVP